MTSVHDDRENRPGESQADAGCPGQHQPETIVQGVDEIQMELGDADVATRLERSALLRKLAPKGRGSRPWNPLDSSFWRPKRKRPFGDLRKLVRFRARSPARKWVRSRLRVARRNPFGLLFVVANAVPFPQVRERTLLSFHQQEERYRTLREREVEDHKLLVFMVQAWMDLFTDFSARLWRAINRALKSPLGKVLGIAFLASVAYLAFRAFGFSNTEIGTLLKELVPLFLKK